MPTRTLYLAPATRHRPADVYANSEQWLNLVMLFSTTGQLECVERKWQFRAISAALLPVQPGSWTTGDARSVRSSVSFSSYNAGRLLVDQTVARASHHTDLLSPRKKPTLAANESTPTSFLSVRLPCGQSSADEISASRPLATAEKFPFNNSSARPIDHQDASHQADGGPARRAMPSVRSPRGKPHLDKLSSSLVCLQETSPRQALYHQARLMAQATSLPRKGLFEKPFSIP